MFITTRALVLREVKYKEADKILTVLTEDEGKMTVRARGALRKGSHYGAAAQQMTFSEMTLFGNKGRWSLNEASTVEQFLGLREDIKRLALGSYICELLEAVTDEDSPNPELLRLGLNSLYALSRGLCSQEQLRAAFELRLMCLSGYEPTLDACCVCGEQMPQQPVFDVAGGELRCGSCGSDAETVPLCEGSLAAMRHISSADSRRIFSFSLDAQAMARLSRAAESYSHTQLERGFGSLEYYKTL